ncbi:MAG: hypothetical protein IJ518_01890 [Clostridia bacterium]|nr:hypothetical protein [Clostridia bacterium]
MLERRLWGVRCRLSLLFPALITALLLWQPDGLAVSCVVASVVHEGGHLLAMLLLGYPPESCTVGAFGMRIRLGRRLPGYGHNMLISFAGPAANLLSAGLLLLADTPTAAAVHLVLAGFNLLPASALDGGELLRCGLCLLGFETLAKPLLRLTSALVLLPLAAGSFWLFLRGWGNGTLLIVSAYLVLLVFLSDKNEKNS